MARLFGRYPEALARTVEIAALPLLAHRMLEVIRLIVLSPEEVARLLEAAPGVKYKAALGVAYALGCACPRSSR